jgi:hypothetical protein
LRDGDRIGDWEGGLEHALGADKDFVETYYGVD